jgi:hypothetical protein
MPSCLRRLGRVTALCVLVAAVAVPAARADFDATGTGGSPVLVDEGKRVVPKRVGANPANRLLDVPIDGYRYDYARRCLKRPQRGTVMLQSWLGSHVRGSFWGITRCEKLSRRNYSLHSEGRAIDWHLDVHNRADRRAAKRLIDLLLAPDKVGNRHALARRMGVQEIIWNCRSWWSGSESLGRYSACYDRKGRRRRIDDTTAHRDHIHIGLNRLGAKGKTSFWRSRR